MAKKTTFLNNSTRNLFVVIAFFGFMSGGLLTVNYINTPRDFAQAQSAPETPKDSTETTIIPIKPSTASTTGNQGTTSTTTSATTGSTTLPTTPTQSGTTKDTPPTLAPTQTGLVDGTNQTVVSGNITPTTTTPVSASNFEQDNTVRSGGFEFGLASFAIIALAGGYYYYKKYGNTKSTLKIQEQKIGKRK